MALPTIILYAHSTNLLQNVTKYDVKGVNLDIMLRQRLVYIDECLGRAGKRHNDDGGISRTKGPGTCTRYDAVSGTHCTQGLAVIANHHVLPNRRQRRRSTQHLSPKIQIALLTRMNTNDSLITTVTTDMAAPSISPQKKHTFPGLYSHIERGSAPSTPNNHPYAIKTTSTAVLTRSNSSSGHAAQFVHAYIPTTPSRSTMQKHRYSKSDVGRATAEPRPLPIPPALESPPKKHTSLERGKASEDLLFPPLRSRRSETLPSAPAPPLPSPVKVDDLPSNPRVWTTSQLASYLMTALRVKSGDSLPLPLPIAKDIALFVKEARLNGRAFLRLNEQDFEA